jgi:hypothetical protein
MCDLPHGINGTKGFVASHADREQVSRNPEAWALLRFVEQVTFWQVKCIGAKIKNQGPSLFCGSKNETVGAGCCCNLHFVAAVFFRIAVFLTVVVVAAWRLAARMVCCPVRKFKAGSGASLASRLALEELLSEEPPRTNARCILNASHVEQSNPH